MIQWETGNILAAQVACIVNPVNCVGVMGAGLAKQIAARWPEVYPPYRELCDQGEMVIGRVLLVPVKVHTSWEGSETSLPRYIACVPTKEHWKQRSNIWQIQRSLKALVSEILSRNLQSVACPMLGCGLGGLREEQVIPLLEEAFAPLTAAVQLYKSR